MKQLSAGWIIGILLVIFHNKTYSQKFISNSHITIIEPYPLAITFYKTTNLVFPYAIRSVDRGSRDVLVQKAKGAENVLLVKAGKENFAQTNLSVITADGKLYSFLLDYTPNPAVLNLSFSNDTATEEKLSLVQSGNNQAQIQTIAERVFNGNRTIYDIKDNRYKIQLCLDGLYTKEDHLYFQLEIKNRSNIPYDIEGLRFYIQDERRTRRTAFQQTEALPVYVHGDTSGIKAQSRSKLLFVLPKFTLPEQKYLLIELQERSGGRHLHLKVHNRTIVRARFVQ